NKPSRQELPVGFCISRDILGETLSARVVSIEASGTKYGFSSRGKLELSPVLGHKGESYMSQETQRHDIAKKRVVYQMPAEHAVTIRRDVEYRVTDAGALTMDIYHPPDSKKQKDARITAVIFVNGYPDPGAQKMIGCKFKEMESYISWGKLTAASGLVAITYTTGKEPAADIHALLQYVRQNAAVLGIDENR